MIREYMHEIGREVRPISGGMSWKRRGSLTYMEKRSSMLLETPLWTPRAVESGGCRYALVPGYVRQFKTRQDEQGLWISEVEPIIDRVTRQEITRVLKEKEIVQQVQF
jgi:hypothetical protein